MVSRWSLVVGQPLLLLSILFKTAQSSSALSVSVAAIVRGHESPWSRPETVRGFLAAGRRYVTLGTDGFGRSDTRAALRDFFGVDAAHIVKAVRHALSSLSRE